MTAGSCKEVIMELFVVIKESMQSDLRLIEGIYKHKFDAYKLSDDLNKLHPKNKWRFFVEIHYLRVDGFPIV